MEETMEPRLDYTKQAQEPIKAMYALGGYLARCGLEERLLELVKIRASQLNGCAYCIDMHTKDARAAGETEQRIYALSAWRETPFFTARERAALGFTEAVTLLAQDHVPAMAYAAVAAEYAPDEIAALVSLLVAINAWNT